jgi:hypothetical protein
VKSPREIYIENMQRIDFILNKGYNPNRDKLGRFTYGDGGVMPTLNDLYDKYPKMKTTLDKMDTANTSYKKSEENRLNEIYNSISKKESVALTTKNAYRKKLEDSGKSLSEIINDKTYIELNNNYEESVNKSREAFNDFRNYKEKRDKIITRLKEDLYESTYGTAWKTKYENAHKTLSDWGGNRYAQAKKEMSGKNYGSLELEHALTQAYYLRNGVKEVEIHWGLYGNTAENIISKKSKIKKDITSVSDSKEIAKSYASMGRMTTGTKKYINNRNTPIPTQGVVVTAKVPINKIIISHKVVADTGYNIYSNYKIRKTSPGGFLKKQNELIIDVPSNANTSNFEIIPTSTEARKLHEAIMSGKTWNEVI